MREYREAGRLLLPVSINELGLQDAAKIVAAIFCLDQGLTCRWIHFGANDVNVMLLDHLLRKQIHGVRKLHTHVHSLSRPEGKTRKGSVDHKPGRVLRRTGFIKDVKGLLRLNAEAAGRKLEVNIGIEWAVSNFAILRNREAPRFEHDVQRDNPAIDVFDVALGGISQLVNQRAYGLSLGCHDQPK